MSYGLSPTIPAAMVSYLPLGPADVEIVQGNNYPPLQWQFLAQELPDIPFSLAGSVFKLRLAWPGAAALTSSSDVPADNLTLDDENGMVSWGYSLAQSRALPLGRLTSYELERWIGGTQQTLVRGMICISAGNNPD